MAAQIREVEQSRQELVRSVLEVGVPRRSQSSIQIHLIPGSPRSSISPTSSSKRTHGLHASSARLEFPYLSARGQALSVAMWAELGGREVCKMGSTIGQYTNLFPTGGWEHGLGRLLSIQDTFIFPESNSASGSARPRRRLFSTWKLERD